MAVTFKIPFIFDMLRSDRFTYDDWHVRNGDFIVFLDRFTSFEGNPEIKSIEKKIRQNEVVMFLKKSKHIFLRQIAGG